MVAVLDQLTAVDGARFGVDLTGVRLETSDMDWSWGAGEATRADGGQLVALVSGRTFARRPDPSQTGPMA